MTEIVFFTVSAHPFGLRRWRFLARRRGELRLRIQRRLGRSLALPDGCDLGVQDVRGNGVRTRFKRQGWIGRPFTPRGYWDEVFIGRILRLTCWFQMLLPVPDVFVGCRCVVLTSAVVGVGCRAGARRCRVADSFPLACLCPARFTVRSSEPTSVGGPCCGPRWWGVGCSRCRGGWRGGRRRGLPSGNGR